MFRKKAPACARDLPPAAIVPSGAVSGAFAGTVMAVALAADANSRGFDPGYPFQLILSGIFRSVVVLTPALYSLVGLAIHYAVSISLGILFSRLTRCRMPGAEGQMLGDRALAAGALFGAAVWAVMTFAALPLANPGFRAYALGHSVWWCVFHLIFGSMLAFDPLLRTPLKSSGDADLPAAAGSEDAAA